MTIIKLSALKLAEKLTLQAYELRKDAPPIVAEIAGRAAALLLSPAAALDLGLHGMMVLPTFGYAIGRSIITKERDLTLPWQHLQRVRNAVSPILLGSACGLIHPYFGLVVSEPTDKHAAIGMLASNCEQKALETPCSQIHSLSIIEGIAKRNPYCMVGGVKKRIFTAEHLQAIRGANRFERSLESLQAQEFVHKISNVTVFAMAYLLKTINSSSLSTISKAVTIRLSGLLIPVLSAVDLTIALLMQSYFLLTGVVRLISGRGPIYTEVTTNPLMHASFLIQNILKTLGNMLCTPLWLISPMTAFRCSLIPTHLFFKLQLALLMTQVKLKMYFAKDKSRFVLPIIIGNGECSVLSVPTHSMHTTYLIVEKQAKAFNLYWVNRPDIQAKSGLSSEKALKQIRSMFVERFPFMDVEKMMNYPVKSQPPAFKRATPLSPIAPQGNQTNCVVSNLFGMLEALDILNGTQEMTPFRYAATRIDLMEKYNFYKRDFFPFNEAASLNPIWKDIKKVPAAPI